MLQVTENDCNELYCLGWVTPETKLFVDMCKGTNKEILTGDE